MNAASITSGTVTASTTQDGNSAATISNLSSTVKVVAGADVTTLNLTGTNTTLRMAGQSLTSGATTNMSESLGIESNGTAANTLTLTAGQTIAKAVVTGSQSLTLKGGLPLVTAKTVSKSLTGNATLTYEVNATMSATADLTNVKADVVNLNVASAMGTYGLTLQSGSTVKLSKNVGDMGTGGLIANTTGVTNTSADTLNINLAASQTGVTTSGFETVNLAVNSTSATISTGVFTTSGDVVVTGSNDLTISTLTSVRTLDASSLNGKLTVSALGTVAMTVAGGAGNDTVTFAEGTNNQTITTGAGADTVNIEITAGATIADTIVAGSGDDTVNLTATTGAISHSSAPTMTAAVLNGGAGTDTLNLGTTSAQFLTVTNSAAGTLTLNGVTNFENINVFIHATGVAAAHTNAVSLVTVDDNVSAGGTLNLGVKITDGGTTASYAKTYTINGGAEKDGSLNISITQLGTQYGTYSTFTITGGDLGDTISGGKGIDRITGGKGVDSIFLAAGGDDVVVVAGGDTGLTQATADVINGANAGDTIDFTSVTATIGATAADLGTGWSVSSGVASKSGSTLAEFITAVVAKGAAGSVNGITSTAYAYASGTDLYIYAAGANASASSDDILVLIVGGSANTLTASSGDIVLV